jgi:hypothetical protein
MMKLQRPIVEHLEFLNHVKSCFFSISKNESVSGRKIALKIFWNLTRNTSQGETGT